MFGPLTKLWQAVAALADNLNVLASTVAQVNTGIRARLDLDPPAEVPALEAPAEGNGTGRRKRQAA